MKQDPLALAFFGAALALLAGLLLYVLFFRAPEPASSAHTADIVDALRKRAAGMAEKFAERPAEIPAVKPAAKPAAKPPAQSPAAAPAIRIEAGHIWRYSVVVEPPVWRDVTLTYRTQREGDGVGVLTDFLYAGGKSNFHLGTFAPGHPSHANTRFPGFFMHASYLPAELKEGARLSWGWPWQPVRAGRMKRYEGRVLRWEDVQVPAGTYSAAVIECELSYIEEGKVQARARETLWYAPAVSQIVKIVREGRTPDEASSRIVAELAEFR